MFNDNYGRPLNLDDPDDCRNWCGGNGEMLAMDYNGIWYPCLRYMSSSLGTKREPITCGNINDGIDHSVLKEMQKVTVLTCSTEECIKCPVAKGCSYCSAYNYEVYGTLNKRVINSNLNLKNKDALDFSVATMDEFEMQIQDFSIAEQFALKSEYLQKKHSWVKA